MAKRKSSKKKKQQKKQDISLIVVIILSVLLGMYVNPNFYWFTLFVGANLLQSSFTNWCLLEDILRKVFKYFVIYVVIAGIICYAGSMAGF